MKLIQCRVPEEIFEAALTVKAMATGRLSRMSFNQVVNTALIDILVKEGAIVVPRAELLRAEISALRPGVKIKRVLRETGVPTLVDPVRDSVAPIEAPTGSPVASVPSAAPVERDDAWDDGLGGV